MLNNKILFDIYKSVKFLDNDKMNENTKKINGIISKYHNSKLYNQYGGTIDSNTDYNDIMENLSSIETGFLDYFKSLQKYIEIYSKNAEEFEKLLKDRLSMTSLEKLKKSMTDLNLILDSLK
jgi:cell division septal protein FtsQ